MNETEIKKELWHLSRLKKDTQKHTEHRRQINTRIRELKKLKAKSEEVDPEKQVVIDEITKVRSNLGSPVLSDLKKFTVVELQKHLVRVKNGSARI